MQMILLVSTAVLGLTVAMPAASQQTPAQPAPPPQAPTAAQEQPAMPGIAELTAEQPAMAGPKPTPVPEQSEEHVRAETLRAVTLRQRRKPPV